MVQQQQQQQQQHITNGKAMGNADSSEESKEMESPSQEDCEQHEVVEKIVQQEKEKATALLDVVHEEDEAKEDVKDTDATEEVEKPKTEAGGEGEENVIVSLVVKEQEHVVETGEEETKLAQVGSSSLKVPELGLLDQITTVVVPTVEDEPLQGCPREGESSQQEEPTSIEIHHEKGKKKGMFSRPTLLISTGSSRRRSLSGSRENGKHSGPRKRRMIGDYEVIQFLGRGMQGTVLKCKNVFTHDVVAIKTVPGGSLVVGGNLMGARNRKGGMLRGRGGMNHISKAVAKEIALLKKVKHPNIVCLLDVIDTTTDHDIHLVFEFVPGGPLRQLSDNLLLKNSGLPLMEDEARCYFRQMCSAIQYLHHHGIVHRDIKPSNLIVDRTTKHLKLTDLGIAVQTNNSKESKILGADDILLATTIITGTPAFLPPEYYKIKLAEENEREMIYGRLEDGGNDLLESGNMNTTIDNYTPTRQYYQGRSADIWACGVTLYAFIYGGLPHLQNPRRFSSAASRFHAFSSTSSSSSSQDPLPPSSSDGEYDRSTRSKRDSNMTVDEMQFRIINNPLKLPGTGLGTSRHLRNLLQRMLDKDPRTRIDINEICRHEWVCKYEPMPPLKEEEKRTIQPSTDEQSNAISLISNNLLRSLQRSLRKLRSKAHILSNSYSSPTERSFRKQELRKSMDVEHENYDDEVFEN